MNSATEAIHIIEHAIVPQVREKGKDSALSLLSTAVLLLSRIVMF